MRVTIKTLETEVEAVNAMRPQGFTTNDGVSPLILNADHNGYRIDLSDGSHISERATGRETLAFLQGMKAAFWAAEALRIPTVWP